MSAYSAYTCSNCFKNDQFHYILCEDEAGHACCYACHNNIFNRWTGRPGNGFSCAICCDEAHFAAGHYTGPRPLQAGTAEDPVLLDGATHAVAKKTPAFEHGQPVGLKKEFILRVFPNGNPEGCSEDAFTSTAKKGATVYVWGDHEAGCAEVCIGLIHNGDDISTHYGHTRPDLGMIAADMVYAVPGEYETFEIARVNTRTRENSDRTQRMHEGDGDAGCSSMAAARRFG